jgi:hypothetical protein
MCGECFEKEKCLLGHYSGQKVARIEAEWSIFRQNEVSRSTIWIVNALHIDFISGVGISCEFYIISVHPDSSIDPWALISGPKRTKNLYIWSK